MIHAANIHFEYLSGIEGSMVDENFEKASRLTQM